MKKWCPRRNAPCPEGCPFGQQPNVRVAEVIGAMAWHLRYAAIVVVMWSIGYVAGWAW